MTYVLITWTVGAVITVGDMQQLTDNGEDARTQLVDGHDHDGVNSPIIPKASATFTGSTHIFREETAAISAGGTADVYLTEEGTSGGTNIFSSTKPPIVTVQRSQASGGDGSNLHVGHNTSASLNYTWRRSWTGSTWKITVYNNDPSTSYKFDVFAEGVD